MVKYEVIPATLDHALELAENMREADREEVWAAANYTPEQAALFSLDASRDAMTGLADDRVVCMFGVGAAAIISTTGVPWLLTTDLVGKHARPFLRRNKKVVEEMNEKYVVLRNYVDARNTMAIRWLRWLGFDVLPSVPFGAEGLPFHPFEMWKPATLDKVGP